MSRPPPPPSARHHHYNRSPTSSTAVSPLAMTEAQAAPAVPPSFLEPSFPRLPPPSALAAGGPSSSGPVRPSPPLSRPQQLPQQLPPFQFAPQAAYQPPPPPPPHQPLNTHLANRHSPDERQTQAGPRKLARLETQYSPRQSSSASYGPSVSPRAEFSSKHASQRPDDRHYYEQPRPSSSESPYRSPGDAAAQPHQTPLPSPGFSSSYAPANAHYRSSHAPHASSASASYTTVTRAEAAASARTHIAPSNNIPGLPVTKRSLDYRLIIRQQPRAARACGFGERDRRVIDPPPIVQLEVVNRITGQPDPDEMRYSLNVVQCTLWSEDGTTEETSLSTQDRGWTRRLMGQLVASSCVAKDEHDIEGCFFCFPDLSCRTNGNYRLQFALIRVDPTNLHAGGVSPILTTELSQVFTVYTAKDFPGMRPSSALTRALKLQGCNIQVKKGNEKALAARKRAQFSSDEDRGGGNLRPSGSGWAGRARDTFSLR